ncbi:MAG: hypothetical protein H0U75_04855 [Legionella sp.]|nr:hypothetical protein [Legionella sp.]
MSNGNQPYKCISWSAILVGALVGVGLSFLLNLFSIAIGLSAVGAGKSHLAYGGMIGIIISVIVSMLAAGYAAGYLGRGCSRDNLGILYGFTTWCLALLLSSIVLTHITHYASQFSENVTGSNFVKGQNSSTSSGAGKSSSSAGDTGQGVNAEVADKASDLANGAFVIFGLFFIGAISACAGAYWAMASKRDDEAETV